VVIEAAFANAFDMHVGDPVVVNGRSFRVVGVAVSAATPPYPGTSCIVPPGCASGASPETLAKLPPGVLQNPGLVWLTRTDVQTLTTDPAYVMNLKLADANRAQAFADARVPTGPLGQPGQPGTASNRGTRSSPWATEVAGDSQILLMIGAWLLGLLAVASLSVLVGGQMADQTRRVGLLNAVGGTPKLVAVVLLTEYVVVALVAAAAGLLIGALTAPLLTEQSAGLIGSAGTPAPTLSTIVVVTVVALGVAVLATFVPAVRAARVSTIDALAEAARPPRRTGWLIAASARLPVPLLLALRVAARRPRRAALAVASIAITISGIFVVLILNAFLTDPSTNIGYDDAQLAALRRVLLVWMVILLCLAAVNASVITWTTVLDNRHASALTRALGATPHEVSSAMAAAQVIPALVGAVLGVFPCGYLLFAALMAATGGDGDRATMPSWWQLVVLVVVTVLVVAALTALPARLGGRRPVTETL
jgi:putative ABC transport system permease protein